jgi:hypothetical protein
LNPFILSIARDDHGMSCIRLDSLDARSPAHLNASLLGFRQQNFLHFRVAKSDRRHPLRRGLRDIARTKPHLDPGHLLGAMLQEQVGHPKFSCLRHAPGSQIFASNTVAEPLLLFDDKNACALTSHRDSERRSAQPSANRNQIKLLRFHGASLCSESLSFRGSDFRQGPSKAFMLSKGTASAKADFL